MRQNAPSNAGYQETRLRMRRGTHPKTRMLEFYLLFAVILLTGSLVLSSLTRNQWEQQIKTADLALVQVIADQIEESGAKPAYAWLRILAADRDIIIMLTDAAERTSVFQADGSGALADETWINWQEQVTHRTPRYGSGTFTTTAPDGQDWLHSYNSAPDGTTQVVVQRPFPDPSLLMTTFTWGLVAITGFHLLISFILLLFLFHKVITPLEKLEIFSGLVRWRGRLRPEEQAYLDQLAIRNDQVGQLAHSLSALAQDIEARFIQLATLLEISRIVASSLDVVKVIENILDQVQTLFQVERCAVIALDRRMDVFRIRASRGLSEAYVNQLRIAPSMPASTAMRALRKQTPVQVSDTETDLSFAAFRPRARDEGFRSVLAIPLFNRHAPPAVLLLFKSEPYRYSYSELEMASSFANHASIAMENATLYERSDERLQEQTRQLEAIVESLNDGLILESTTGAILYCNQQAAELAQLPRRDAVRKSATDLLEHLLATAGDRETAVHNLNAVQTNPQDHTFDFTRKLASGRSQDLRIHLFNVTDAQGDLIGRGQLWQDITSDKELDRMKSALLSTVSHELRTPLAAIKGYASTLLADDVVWDAASQREFLQTISDETDRLARLVENLLDMSRIEAGTLSMNLAHCPLSDLIAPAAEQVCAETDPRLQLRISEDIPPLWVDASRMETVIRNLLENAVKYSPPGTDIELTAHRENGRVIIQVRDYGPGIPDALRDKVFDRFYRADSRLTARVGGAGLGLAICKGFVEAHGGDIWVADGAPGTIIGFALPLGEKHDR